MDLCEEYIQRHRLESTFVRFDRNKSVLVMKCRENKQLSIGDRYEVSILEWTQEAEKPGYFLLSTWAAHHNGGIYSSLVHKIVDTRKKDWEANPDGYKLRLEWDLYEDYIVDWAKYKKANFEGVKDHALLQICCWEMFLYMFDGVLSNMSDSLWSKIGDTLDSGDGILDRLSKITECIDYFGKNIGNDSGLVIKSLHEGWEHLRWIHGNPERYNFWLANLVNNG